MHYDNHNTAIKYCDSTKNKTVPKKGSKSYLNQRLKRPLTQGFTRVLIQGTKKVS